MKFLQKVIPKIFAVVFIYILILIMFFGHIQYVTKADYLFPNIFSLVISFIIFTLFCKYKNEKELSNKKFIIGIILISLITYLVQLFIQGYCVFSTGWDAGLIEANTNYFNTYGSQLYVEYMTRYPNNLFIQFIFIVITKLPIPIIGGGKKILLVVNSLQVNIACILACLTINNVTKNKKLALSSYLVMIPLIMLNPWILVLYSDTFSIMYPVGILYLYTRENKGKIELFLIVFLAIIGYFIKPTIIITLMAIGIVELFKVNPKLIKKAGIKKCISSVAVVLCAILIAFAGKKVAISYLHFQPVEGVHEFTIVHFLCMGQNDKSDGVFNDPDYIYSLENGMDNNFNRFLERLTSRSPIEQVQFFSRKTLVNFNNGSFSWGREGTFYSQVKPSKSHTMSVMRSIFYTPGKYYKYLLQMEQWIWLLVLTFCPFIIKKENSNKELAIMLAILGITAFLTIFEARGRYLYCYSPVFVTCATLGMYHLKEKVLKRKKNK